MTPETQKVYDQFKSYIVMASSEYRVREEIITAMIFVESFGNPMAQASTTSARGLMQITRGAASDMGVPYELLFDPAENILCGTAYLAQLIRRNGGDERRGVMAYYAGHGTINDDKETQLDRDAEEYADKVYSHL